MFYFFAGVLFFQGIYVFTQWRKYRRPDYLYYCFYILGVIFYFFFMFYDEFLERSAFFDMVRAVKKPTVLLTFLLYTLFVEHFIETYKHRRIQKVMRVMQVFVIFQIITMPVSQYTMSPFAHFWHFSGGNIVILILSLYILLQLIRISEPLFVFILRGSLCALAGTLVTNILSSVTWLGASKDLPWEIAIAPAMVGLLAESYYFLVGLNYKSFRTEEEMTKKLISQLSENERLLIEKQTIRNKIAQDLHDDIGASLSSIHIYSSVAEKEMIENPEKSKMFLKQITESTRQVMENMSDIVWAMGMEHKEEKSLANRVKDFGYDLLTQKSIECSYHIDPHAEMMITDIEARRNILLIIKEALNNIAKYSEATRAQVYIVRDKENIIITISDNGNGFDMEKSKRGNGLNNMKNRASALGGECRVMSSPGNGTTLQASIPVTSISI